LEKRLTENKPLLILAQEAGGIPLGLSNALKRMRVANNLCIYDKFLYEKHFSLINRIYHRLFDPGYSNDIKNYFNISLHSFSKEIRSNFYSSILIMRGNKLDNENEILLKERSVPLITYLYDPLSQIDLQKYCADLADFVIYVDLKDSHFYPQNSMWLPLGYDDEIYFPSNEEKDIDVFISGSISKRYSKRLSILKSLGKSIFAKKFKMCFIGSTGFSLSDLRVDLGGIEWIAKRVEPVNLAGYQRRAKICINIHRDDSDTIINPSFFSIPGSGSCQIAEKREVLARVLQPDSEYVDFSTNDELFEKLNELLLLKEKRDYIFQKGYERVRKEHTLKERAKQILQILNELNKKNV